MEEKPIMKPKTEKPCKPKILKADAEDKESELEKEATKYRKIIWSRKTMQYTVPKQVANAAMTAAGGVVGSRDYVVKVEWSEALNAIVSKVVPETQVATVIVSPPKQ